MGIEKSNVRRIIHYTVLLKPRLDQFDIILSMQQRLAIWERNREMWKRNTCSGARWTWAGGHGDGRRRESGWVRAAAVVYFPWPSTNPRSVGSVGGSRGNAVNLVLRAPAPTSVYIALPQGPTNHISVGRPRSGRERGVGSSRWTRSSEINLTFSPLISTLLLTLTLHFTHFITDQYIEHVSSSQLNCR
jgi:hypothetical protein